MGDVVYDCECYPNIFTLSAKDTTTGERWLFEISDRVNHSLELVSFIYSLSNGNVRMIGFNNLAYDYPLVHFICARGYVDATMIYEKSSAIIAAATPFEHMVWDSDRIVVQIDLFKIHHFDNVARATSLKVLEFNMRSPNISDLPYAPGTFLDHRQKDELIRYNNHDVDETEKFWLKSLDQIRFREELSAKYNRNFLNHNDTKIGKDYFIMRLEAAGVACFEGQPRRPIQTRRDVIHLRETMFPYVQFQNPEFRRVIKWFLHQSITDTKGVFKDVTATINGFTYVFGTGGIHGSVYSQHVVSDDEYAVLDFDVASYYPNLAIANRLYPAHLGEQFCEIYEDVYRMRSQYAKGTGENAMLKLALNGVYGDSNNKYSPFFDPLYTMQITINGQLLLCMLAEWMSTIPTLSMVQINTDGLTVRVHRTMVDAVRVIAQSWESFTRLTLEEVEYRQMFIRDVNNYIAEDMNGKLKRKGAYEFKMQWHQNHSALVIPKAAQAVLIDGEDAEEFIRSHDDSMDFMLRAKVPRSSRLKLEMPNGQSYPLQNITRFYASKTGGSLVKTMPPLAKKPGVWRDIGILVGWNVWPCNNMIDATQPIDYDYYISETLKLTEIFK